MREVLATVILGAMLGLMASLVGIMIASYRIPGLPLRYRMMPVFILREEELWTPAMRRLKRLGMWSGVALEVAFLGIVIKALFL